ncbi:MAG: VOC family protein [Limisphaerales bacterium]
MSTHTKAIPDGFHTLTPYLSVRGAAKAIEFYERAFGAKERFRMAAPDGKSVGHAEIAIGDSIVMLADEMDAFGNRSPESLKGTPVNFMLYVENSDAAFERAVQAGARVIRPLADQFYGDRSGCVEDPFGYQWTVSTHQEDVPPEELKTRMAAFCAKMAQAKH